MHNHPNGIHPAFSEKDIIGRAEFFSVKDDLGVTDAEEITSILVTPRGLFALRVDDPNKVIAFNQDMKTGMDEEYKPLIDEFYATFFDDIYREAQKDCNGQCTVEEFLDKVEEYYIKWLEAWDTGLSLYKGTENLDGTYMWEKQE